MTGRHLRSGRLRSFVPIRTKREWAFDLILALAWCVAALVGYLAFSRAVLLLIEGGLDLFEVLVKAFLPS